MDYIESLRQVIRRLHGCDSKYIESHPVKETFHGKVVWNGTVELFDLIDHPKASRCYAWSYKDDSREQHFKTVLELPPVDSPRKAVQAFIINEMKMKK